MLLTCAKRIIIWRRTHAHKLFLVSKTAKSDPSRPRPQVPRREDRKNPVWGGLETKTAVSRTKSMVFVEDKTKMITSSLVYSIVGRTNPDVRAIVVLQCVTSITVCFSNDDHKYYICRVWNHHLLYSEWGQVLLWLLSKTLVLAFRLRRILTSPSVATIALRTFLWDQTTTTTTSFVSGGSGTKTLSQSINLY